METRESTQQEQDDGDDEKPLRGDHEPQDERDDGQDD
jgi:hypothetical protein